MKWLISTGFLLTTALASGQIVIGANTYINSADPGNPANVTTLVTAFSIPGSSTSFTAISNLSANADFSKVNLILSPTTTTKQTISTSSPLTFSEFEINSGANFDLDGTWTIANKLTLTKAKLIPKSGTGKLVYTGSSDVEGSDVSFIDGGFYRKGTGKLTFPIGDANGYAPAVLEDIALADANTELGFSITSQNPGFQYPTTTIKDVYPDRFWNMSIGTGGSFSGSKIWLSTNNVGASFESGSTVLEMTQTNSFNNLGGSHNSSFYSSTNKASTKPKSFAIAINENAKVIVYKLITPNDDEDNNVLFIDGIDQHPENEVTLLDRWGVLVKSWTNYTNAQSKDQPEFFKKLGTGNYVCVVKYKDLEGVTKTVQQMISLLK